jgi:hypothetical protein
MTRSQFERRMTDLLKREPFQPFAIEFDDGQRWVVNQPKSVWYTDGDTAIYSHPDGNFDFVDCDVVKELSELSPAATA